MLQLQKGRWVPALGVCLVFGGCGRLVGLEGVLVGVCGEVTKAAQEMHYNLGCGVWAGRGQPCSAACQALLRGSE